MPLLPQWEQGQKIHFCGTTLFAGNSGRSVTVPTHRLPVNAGIASEDTLEASISLCPQRPLFEIAFRSPLSNGELSVDALSALLPPQWFLYQVMPVIQQLCAFVKHQFSPSADTKRPQYPVGECQAPFLLYVG